jgi:hypothetical protein
MKKAAILILIGILFISCEKENNNILLSFKAMQNVMKSASVISSHHVVIEDFRLSIRDVEFKNDDSQLDSADVQFRGPFDLDLASATNALSQTIGDAVVDPGLYKVLRFKLHKSREREASHVLYDRSLYMNGSINGVPFEFWHDTSENMDLEDDLGIQVTEEQVEVSVLFHMDQFLSSFHSIDLSQAADNDGDGLIEINPDDDDDNGWLADELKENIKYAADLIKE